MTDLKGMAYLRRRLNQKRSRVLTRYKYYEMKNAVKDFGKVTPDEFRFFSETLGWCGKAVDALADRLVWREFRDDNFDLNSIYQMNNADTLFDSAVLSALISSCCFLYISPDGSGYPRLQVIDGGNATGIMDEVTGLLTEGYAVLARDPETDKPLLEAYFTTGSTWYYPNGQKPYQVPNPAPGPAAGARRVPPGRQAALWPQPHLPCLHGPAAGSPAHPQAQRDQRRVLFLPAEICAGHLQRRRADGQVEGHHFQLSGVHQGRGRRQAGGGPVHPAEHEPLHRAAAHFCRAVRGRDRPDAGRSGVRHRQPVQRPRPSSPATKACAWLPAKHSAPLAAAS